jgi:putative toxin-antitoxin system antitoxin component (TIGR02293 family)
MRELDALVRDGMPRTALDVFIDKVGGGARSAYAVQLRNRIVPRATYRRVERFNLQVSETTERMARLYAMALAVFEEPDAAARFLSTTHPELGNRTPFEAALTEIGGREVEEVIERGLHGLPV